LYIEDYFNLDFVFLISHLAAVGVPVSLPPSISDGSLPPSKFSITFLFSFP